MYNDSNKVNSYITFGDSEKKISNQYKRKLFKDAIKLSNQLNWEKGIALAHFRLGKNYWSSGMFDSAIYCHKISLQLYQKMGDRFNEAYMLCSIGQDFADSGAYDMALFYFDKSLEIHYELEDKQAESFVNSLKAWVYNNKGDFVSSNIYQNKYLKYAETMLDTQAMTFASISIAENYLQLKKYASAIESFKKWQKYWLIKQDNMMLAQSYNGLGNTYFAMGQKNDMIQSYHLALFYATKDKNDYLLAEVYENLGEFYFQEKKYKECIQYLNQSLLLSESHNNRKRLMGIYSTLCKSYIYTNQLDLAKKSIEIAESISKIIDSRSALMEFFKSKSLYESKIGNWEKAYIYERNYQELRDSIYNESNTKKIYEIQLNYEIDKKEIALQEESKKRKLYTGFAIVSFLTLILFFLYAKRKNSHIEKMNRLILQENEKQKILLKELHHRVKNNLQMVISFLQLQINKTKDENGQKILIETANSIQSISWVYEHLYQKDEFELVNLNNYVQNILFNIINGSGRKDIEFIVDCEDILLEFDKTISLGLIINELITNSYQHGFREKNGTIWLTIKKNENKIHFNYQDNGIGFIVPVNISTKTIGLKLIVMLIDDLNGTYKIDGQAGFQISFIF